MASKDADEKCSNSKTEETIALEKKRSKSRRVSFAETTAIHLFIRDEDCETPPAVEESSARIQRSDSDEIRELLVTDSDSDDDKDRVSLEPSFLRPLESPSPGSYFGSATSNDEDNFFGPVSADFIRPGRLSDSAVSEDNHDVTMDSTAFSMHFRSLARSESGGEFKTPTGARLAFGERTFGQISTSGGDSMVLTASNKRVSDSVLAETVNGSGNSDDMSVVGEHSRIYDYGELPPELDILLADDGKDKGASHTSQFEHSNPIQHDKRDAGSCLNPSGVELLSSSNREIDAQLGLNVEKASDGAISAIQVILDKGNDGIPVKLSKDRTNSPNVMPVDENDHERQDAVELSGNFQSPLPTSHSHLNHDQRIAGSVSSILEERRQIFRVLPIDESNLILSEKRIHEGSKHVLSASTLEKSVSRVKRHTFPFTSASKAESNASRLRTLDSVTRSLIRNNSLRTNSKDLLIEHMAAPVACLDEQFLNVAGDDGEIESMGKISKSNMKTLGDLQNANYIEANDAEMSSLSATVGSHDDSAKSSVSRSPLALSTEKQFNPSVSRVTHTKEIASITGSDCFLLEISSNVLKHNLDSVKSGDSTFFPTTNVGKMVSASPLYQESLSKNPNQQVGSNLSLSRVVKQMVVDDLGSRSKINSPLVTESKNEAERSSSDLKHFQTVSHAMQNDESTLRNFHGFPGTFTCSEHALIDKASDLGELVINRANIGTGTMSMRAFPVEDMKPVTGDVNPMKLPIQVSESSKGELSYSLIQKKPCLTDDTIVHPFSGNRILTPRSYPFSSVDDENDQPVSESPKIYDADRPSSLKRKLFDKAKYDNDEITAFQHKPKFSKDQKQGNVKEARNIGSDSTARDWVDVFTSFLGMTKLSPALINKLNLTQIRMLDEILVHLDKMRSYELLYRDICSQEAFKIANYQQTKRLADMKLLLYRTLYQKAKVQLMHLEREKLLVQLRQLDSKVEESNMLISSSHGSQINSQKDIEIDSFLPVSCLVAAEIPSLRKELEVSEKSIRNLHDSFHTYIKDVKELTCTETTVCIKNLLNKRVACRSLRSELQLCQVGSITAVDGKRNILFDHGCIMSQRFMVKSVSNGLYISNTLDDVKISMMSIGDVYTAFSFVLHSETNLAYSGLEVIAQEVQKTTSLLHTLLDVVEEVCLAMVELKNLTGSKFLQPSGKLNLQLSFTDFNSGARVVLSVDVTCLKWGLYPSQVLPYEVQVSPAARHESLRLLLDSINSAIHGVRFGYIRILNLCRCVSRTIQANCIN
ncbi:uncharacterized protein LOC130801530 isoform X2 [Amaranthus tricolor]|uniref:uncharacterized protein LOC130801530 isoform X2 n=1 Tax=Amaranthus tricolor TaxID=29722 RepID=UPI002589EEDB|nr:uncharacterized protein LOC130801530 isoform X2 [Amaranthus tricolor]